jgi:hypothetical protein
MSIWDVAKIAKTAGDFYGEKTKQGRMGPTYKAEHPSVKADPAKLGKKRSFSDKYGGYGKLLVEGAQSMEREGGYGVGGRDSRYERTSSASPDYVSPTIKMGDKWSKKIDIG